MFFFGFTILCCACNNMYCLMVQEFYLMTTNIPALLLLPVIYGSILSQTFKNSFVIGWSIKGGFSLSLIQAFSRHLKLVGSEWEWDAFFCCFFWSSCFLLNQLLDGGAVVVVDDVLLPIVVLAIGQDGVAVAVHAGPLELKVERVPWLERRPVEVHATI